MTKRVLGIAPLLAVLLAGTAACGCNEPGTAQPGSTAPSVQAPAGSSSTLARTSSAPASGNGSAGSGPLDGTDPCSLLPERYLGQLGLNQGRPGVSDPGQSVSCDYESANYGVTVGVFYHVGAKRNVPGQVQKPVTVNGGGRRALQDITHGGVCSISMEVTASSSVDVEGNYGGGDQQQACQLSMLVAKAVEPQLPKS
ncbi:MAG: DUF3558 family protein [Sciscionella sp.]